MPGGVRREPRSGVRTEWPTRFDTQEIPSGPTIGEESILPYAVIFDN